MSTRKQSRQIAETGKYGATCHRSDGSPCNGRPVRGSTVCNRHLVNKHARAHAAVRAAFAQWQPGDPTVDPLEGMLRHATIADRQAAAIAMLIEEGLPDDPNDLPGLVKAFIGTSYGESGPTGEFTRGLVTLHGVVSERAVKFMKLCDEARIAERVVQLEEAKVVAVVSLIRRVLVGAGLDLADRQIEALVEREMLQLEASETAA